MTKKTLEMMIKIKMSQTMKNLKARSRWTKGVISMARAIKSPEMMTKKMVKGMTGRTRRRMMKRKRKKRTRRMKQVKTMMMKTGRMIDSFLSIFYSFLIINKLI